MDVELFNAISRYPFIYNGELFDSKELSQNKTCIEKCRDKDCVKYFSNNNKSGEEYVCSKGYNNLNFAINDFSCFINGLIYESNRIIPTGRKEVRKDWIVDRNRVILLRERRISQFSMILRLQCQFFLIAHKSLLTIYLVIPLMKN